jgi:hypothetical protein
VHTDEAIETPTTVPFTPPYLILPDSVSVIDRTSDSLTIQWEADWDPRGTVTFHELHRGQSKIGAYEAVASIDAADSTFVDQGLEPDSVYYYMVRACNDSGCSGLSSEVAAGVTEASGQVAIPAAPVSWRSGAGIDDDEVWQSGLKFRERLTTRYRYLTLGHPRHIPVKRQRFPLHGEVTYLVP